MSKIHLTSLGCDKNYVDAEVMLALLVKDGFELTNDETEADVIIINTCGFIKDASLESIEHIAQAGELKQTARLKALIVTGCLAQRYKDEIFKEMPEVDAIVGTGDYEKIASVIRGTLLGGKITMVSGKNNSPQEIISENRMPAGVVHTAYLKIAEGCDNNCTYCTIPQIRGGYRSRSVKSLVREAGNLANAGARELVLVAQDTALYGTDIYGESILNELIGELAAVEDIKWLRVLYAYPEHITDAFITEMARNEKVCKYIDMPIQHSENRILKNMGRTSTNAGLREVIGKLRAAMPDIVLRTTLMTGFPGETDAEFNALCRFIEDIQFDRLGVFAYSKEDGTPAARFKSQVSAKTKKARKNALLELQRDISEQKQRSRVGQVMTAIVDGQTDGAYMARTYMDAKDIDGAVFFNADYEILSGEFVRLKILSAAAYDMYGELKV